ncbi:glycosyltransferase family 4 protein [Metabacillus sp. Hm71]|uniref:glycosyltransferase family 4 protein n=1 Tax=Metabacillus sp. Hm71 TaxID=3450743 RepID=UPI003F439D40
MKVIHLPLNASQMSIICKGLRENGVEAKACNFVDHEFGFKDHNDICLYLEKIKNKKLKQQKLKNFYEQVINKYDIFHFHFTDLTVFPSQSELKYFKKLGKKMVIQHCGSEVRRLSVARSFNNPYVQVKEFWQDESRITALLQKLSNIFDQAVVADHELYHYVKDFYKNVHIINQVIDLEKISPSYPSRTNKKPLVVHAPSHQKVKGTEFVLDAVQRLKAAGYLFEFKLIEKMKNERALQLYRQADIIIDQLCIGAFGIVSLEAMALGKPVICFIRDDLIKTYPSNLPIVNASPITIYNVLEHILSNPTERYNLGVKGRKYVEKHYDANIVAKQLIDLYNKI